MKFSGLLKNLYIQRPSKMKNELFVYVSMYSFSGCTLILTQQNDTSDQIKFKSKFWTNVPKIFRDKGDPEHFIDPLEKESIES